LSTATITSKGQITIPVEVRNDLGVGTGDRLEFIKLENGQYSIVPTNRSIRELKGMLRVKRRKPVSIEEMNRVIARRASESR
jgi:AbrB family looped-hinge helix DNA binding protein